MKYCINKNILEIQDENPEHNILCINIDHALTLLYDMFYLTEEEFKEKHAGLYK